MKNITIAFMMAVLSSITFSQTNGDTLPIGPLKNCIYNTVWPQIDQRIEYYKNIRPAQCPYNIKVGGTFIVYFNRTEDYYKGGRWVAYKQVDYSDLASSGAPEPRMVRWWLIYVKFTYHPENIRTKTFRVIYDYRYYQPYYCELFALGGKVCNVGDTVLKKDTIFYSACADMPNIAVEKSTPSYNEERILSEKYYSIDGKLCNKATIRKNGIYIVRVITNKRSYSYKSIIR
jgi:hypothetical protein